MSSVDWNLITQSLNPNDSYNTFIDEFSKIYDEAFPLQKITIKTKNLGSPWITTGIRKSSRKKQCLSENYLKNKTAKTLEAYKQYKSLLNKIRKGSKMIYYQNKHQK